MTLCPRYLRPLTDGHALHLCGLLKARRDGVCADCNREGIVIDSVNEERTETMGIPKNRVWHKHCDAHGDYEGSGPRSACPKCKADAAKLPSVPVADVSGKDSKVIDALVRLKLVDKSAVDYLRGVL